MILAHIITKLVLHLPAEILLVAILCTKTTSSDDDELLRTSTGCIFPSFSLTLYVDWLKVTTKAVCKAHNDCTQKNDSRNRYLLNSIEKFAES